MPSVAEGAIDCGFAGFGGDGLHDLVHHDRTMCAGGGLSRCRDFRDVVGVALRGVFLVLVLETSRVFAGVAFAAFGSLFWGQVAQAVFVAGKFCCVQPEFSQPSVSDWI